ncbi:MAG: DNA primase [Anaerovoracaceae bacterium]
MSKQQTNNVIDEIKSRCDIVEVIGSVVSLKKAGSNYKGCCPFHNEKTPSFVVSPNKQIFTCFGCNATGDVIEFVKRYYNLEFNEALEKLGSQCGVDVQQGYNNSQNKSQLYEMNRDAATFFYKGLRATQNPGLDYVIKRGLSKETLHTFGIGYADPSWDSLYKHLKSKGYKEDKMVEMGLISHSKGKYFDRFRNRVIFPIQNTAGKVIGFGGRALGDDTPKYLNSQETPVFHKKNNLYGLNATKNQIQNKDKAIVVEGYMDVVSLYQGGVTNVAASLGTALTEEQGKLLKRYTKNIVLAYDADNAGVTAAIRGSEILYKLGLVVKILTVTDGKDPDDFIKAKGKLAFEDLVNKALDYPEFRIFKIASKYDLQITSERVLFLKEASEFLKSLNPVEADVYIKKLASKYSISEGAFRTEITGGEQTEVVIPTDNEESNLELSNLISPLEKNFIKIVLTDSIYLDKLNSHKNIFVSEAGKNIISEIRNIYKEGEEIDINLLLDSLESDHRQILMNIDKNIKLAGKTDEIFNQCVKTYREEYLVSAERELIMRISIADENDNIEDIRRLTKELMDLQKERATGGK